MIKSFLKFDLKSREWWKAFGTYLFIYCFVIWLFMVVDHVIHAEASIYELPSGSDSFDNVFVASGTYYASNGVMWYAPSITADSVKYSLYSDDGIIYKFDNGTWAQLIRTGVLSYSPIIFLKGNYEFSSFTGDSASYAASLPDLSGQTEFYRFQSGNSAYCLYLSAYDEFGYYADYYIEYVSVPILNLEGYRDSSALRVDWDAVYYKLEGDYWRKTDPLKLYEVTLHHSPLFFVNKVSGSPVLKMQPLTFKYYTEPTPTITPIPGSDPDIETNDYFNLINSTSTSSYVLVSPIYSNDTFEVYVGVGLGGSWVGSSGYSSISYATRYTFNYSDFSKVSQRYQSSYSFSSLSGFYYSSNIQDRVLASYKPSVLNNFQIGVLESWPYVSLSSTPSPGPSPTPVISQIPYPTQLPYPTNIPPSQLLTDFPAPSGLPGYSDINIPGFNFDNEGFQQSFREDKDKITSLIKTADFSFFGLLSFLPDPVQLMLWLSLAGGIVAMIIRNIRR